LDNKLKREVVLNEVSRVSTYKGHMHIGLGTPTAGDLRDLVWTSDLFLYFHQIHPSGC